MICSSYHCFLVSFEFFIYHFPVSRWRKLEPQQILGFLVLCILLACAGFSFLIVYKHLEGLTAFSNGKYRWCSHPA